MAHNFCLLVLLATYLLGGRAVAADTITADTSQHRPPTWFQLGLGVGGMPEKTGLSFNLGAWFANDWPTFGLFFNYSTQINTSGIMGGGDPRREDNIADLAFLVGARYRGESAWANCALGPATFWETRWQGTYDRTDLSGAALEAVASFGWPIGRGGLGFSFNYLLGTGTKRWSICLVGEISLSD